MPTAMSGPQGIAAGPDGNIWFTESNANQIGQTTLDRRLREFPIRAGCLFGRHRRRPGRQALVHRRERKQGRADHGPGRDRGRVSDSPRRLSPTRSRRGARWQPVVYRIGRSDWPGHARRCHYRIRHPHQCEPSARHTNGPDGNIWSWRARARVSRAPRPSSSNTRSTSTCWHIQWGSPPVRTATVVHREPSQHRPDDHRWGRHGFSAARPKRASGRHRCGTRREPMVHGDGRRRLRQNLEGSRRARRRRRATSLAGGRFRSDRGIGVKVPSSRGQHRKGVAVEAVAGYFRFQAGEIDLAVKASMVPPSGTAILVLCGRSHERRSEARRS